MLMETVINILNGTVTLSVLSFSQSIFFPCVTLEMFIVLAKPVGDHRGYGGKMLLLIQTVRIILKYCKVSHIVSFSLFF